MGIKAVHHEGYVEVVWEGPEPQYDEGNIAYETARLYPVLREHEAAGRILRGSEQWRRCNEAAKASRRMCENALARIVSPESFKFGELARAEDASVRMIEKALAKI